MLCIGNSCVRTDIENGKVILSASMVGRNEMQSTSVSVFSA